MVLDILPYALGFTIYMLFNVLSFEFYSRKKEDPNMMIFYMIYLYYTILAGYIINTVDGTGTFWERFIQTLIYALAGGIVLFHHYVYVITKMNKKEKNNTISF